MFTKREEKVMKESVETLLKKANYEEGELKQFVKQAEEIEKTVNYYKSRIKEMEEMLADDLSMIANDDKNTKRITKELNEMLEIYKDSSPLEVEIVKKSVELIKENL